MSNEGALGPHQLVGGSRLSIADQDALAGAFDRIRVSSHSLLIDSNGEFTAAGALNPESSAGVEDALCRWEGLTDIQLRGFSVGKAMVDRRARDLAYTTLASVAAWLKAEGLLESAWVGKLCEQQKLASLKLTTWSGGSPREVCSVLQ